MDDRPDEAARDRPGTEASYGISDDGEGLLDWSFVVERLRSDRFFWVATTRPDGRPHARPVWGVWADRRFHCGGGERTRRVRNLDRNAGIAVHTEDAESVVILEGTAEKLAEQSADSDRLRRIDDAHREKYGVEHGTPAFAVRPERALARSDYPADATRWRFGCGEGGP